MLGTGLVGITDIFIRGPEAGGDVDRSRGQGVAG